MYKLSFLFTLAVIISSWANASGFSSARSLVCGKIVSALTSNFSFDSSKLLKRGFENGVTNKNELNNIIADILYARSPNYKIQPSEMRKLLYQLFSFSSFRISETELLKIIMANDLSFQREADPLEQLRRIAPSQGYRFHTLTLENQVMSQGDLSLFRTIQLASKAKTPQEIYDLGLRLVLTIPKSLAIKDDLVRATQKMGEIIFGYTQSDYRTGNITNRNEGIANYLRGEMETDPHLLPDAIRFYAQLKVIDVSEDEPRYDIWSHSKGVEIWDLALKSSDNDPFRAIRALAIFGHDEVLTTLPFIAGSTNQVYVDFLNAFAPKKTSVLYAPGALPGNLVPEKMQQKLETSTLGLNDLAEVITLCVPEPYHFIGGAFISEELLRLGVANVAGLDLPTIIAESSASFYKIVAMQRNYLSDDGKIIFGLGYDKVGRRVRMPSGWTTARLERAK